MTVSPKLSQKGKWVLKRGQELKLVYEGQDLSFFEDSAFEHYFLQPKEIRTAPWGGGEHDSARSRVERGMRTASGLRSSLVTGAGVFALKVANFSMKLTRKSGFNRCKSTASRPGASAL